MKSNIVLIGFMGSGKSITGKLLAYRLGYSFVDTDTAIEKLAQKSHQVISTGGGVATKEIDMQELRKNGIVIALTAMPHTILKRTGNDKRPLLAKKSNEERLKTIIELMAKRAPFYKKADLIIKTDDTTPLQNVEIIMKYLKGVK